MLEKNVVLEPEGNGAFSIWLDDPEVRELFENNNGQVHVRISKPQSPGTENQNRAMHALMAEYYKTGLHSAPEGCTLDAFKVYLKCLYGPVYEIDLEGQPVKVPKSWANYSKQERCYFIDGLISEINQSGAFTESPRIREIIAGMSENIR